MRRNVASQITQFPVVPGHEAVGTVSWVGKDVTKFKQGDKVGVGYLYDSCLNCSECKRGNEQFCCGGKSMHNGLPDFTCTCGGVSRWGHTAGVPEGSTVHGGFSTKLVVNQHFGIKLPSDIDLVKAAPLLCAGATMYDPIAANNVGKDTKIGIVGMGGLGSFGVKIAKAKGAHVTAITTSPEKEEMCKKIGADNVVWSKEQMSSPENARSLDIILDTVSAKHSADPNIQELLKFKGTYVVIGIPPEGLQVDSNFLVFGNAKPFTLTLTFLFRLGLPSVLPSLEANFGRFCRWQEPLWLSHWIREISRGVCEVLP